VQVNEVNVSFKLDLRWNKTANYWVLTITDSAEGTIIIDSLPLVTGVSESETLNLLRGYAYLRIGVLYLAAIVAVPSSNFPNETNLETEFELAWGDNT